MEVTLDMSDLVKSIRGFEKASGDVSASMAVVAEMFVAAVNDEFDTAGHGGWAPLAESTLAHRRKHGAGAQILMDTGRSVASVHGESGPDFALAGSNVEYMRYHVGDGPRTKIPKRDPFDIDPETYTRAVEVILADVVKRL